MVKSRSGFTIVELLIVIVVIAILAAITVVAYTGVQQRARNSVTVGAVQEWVKALTLTYNTHGQIDIELTGSDNSICLGTRDQYPAVSDDLGEGQCYFNAHTSDELMDVVSEVADIHMTTYVVDDGEHEFRGLQYVYDVGVSGLDPGGYIYYVLSGEDQDCVVPGSEAWNSGAGITDCRINTLTQIGDHPIRLL